MNLDAQGENKEQQEEDHQLLNLELIQGGSLPDNQAYLDGCSMVTAFKADKYLKRHYLQVSRSTAMWEQCPPNRWECMGG